MTLTQKFLLLWIAVAALLYLAFFVFAIYAAIALPPGETLSETFEALCRRYPILPAAVVLFGFGPPIGFLCHALWR